MQKELIISKSHKQFILSLKPLVDGFFADCEGALVELAERARSNQEQTQFFHSLKEMKTKKERIEKAFYHHITNSFKLFKKGNYQYFENQIARADLHMENMSLLDEKELEKMLAISTTITRADTYLSRQLNALSRRFEVLSGDVQEVVSDIPLSPYVVVYSLVESLSLIVGIGSQVYVTLIKLFERMVVPSLKNVYDEVNASLAQEGVLPNLRYQIKRSEGAQSDPYKSDQTVAAQSDVENQVPKVTEAIKSLAEQAYNEDSKFADLLKNLEVQDNATSKQEAEPAEYDGTMLTTALSLLQLDQLQSLTQNNQTEGRINPADLKEGLFEKLKGLDAGAAEKSIDKVDEMIIDMIGLLFQYVVDSKNLPEPMQDLLVQLQVPYLNLGIKDRSLFANKDHAARQLLEEMAQAAMTWNPEQDRKQRLYNQIKSTVALIVETEPEQIDFSELHDEFSKFQTRNAKRMKIAEKRAKEKAIGQERLNLAKKKSAELLSQLLADTHVPKLVKEILLNDWINVLILAHLRHEDDDQLIQEKIDFVVNLVHASVRDKPVKTPDSVIEELCEQLAEELRKMTYSENQIKETCGELADLLMMLNFDENDQSLFEFEEDDDLAPYKPDDLPDSKQLQADINAAINLKPEAGDNALDDGFKQQAEAMQVGTWIEIRTSESDTTRAKLSWISPISDTRLFVNSRGQKVCSMNTLEMAAGLREGGMEILESKSLFDQVIETVSNNIKAH